MLTRPPFLRRNRETRSLYVLTSLDNNNNKRAKLRAVWIIFSSSSSSSWGMKKSEKKPTEDFAFGYLSFMRM
jgi:hypothetical protein